jgi:hypothetical protein
MKVHVKGRRQYENDYLSVSEVLDHARKIGLEMWFKSKPMAEINEITAKARTIGTQLHEALQRQIEGSDASVMVKTEYPAEIQNVISSFTEFRKDNPNVEFIRSEMALSSDKLRLNGTIDCVGQEGVGQVVLLDWKTGELKGKKELPVYPEYLMQVSAYYQLHSEWCEGEGLARVGSAKLVALAKDAVAYRVVELNPEELDWIYGSCFVPLQLFAYGKRELEEKFFGKKKKSDKKGAVDDEN